MGAGIYRGVMGAVEPFKMTLDRPFILFIRDWTTDALLFLGAVSDPEQH